MCVIQNFNIVSNFIYDCSFHLLKMRTCNTNGIPFGNARSKSDRFRTTVNVWGDAVGAKIISKLAPDTDEDEELEPALA